MLLNSFLKRLVDLNTLCVTIMVPLVILDLIALSFKLLKKSKEKRNLSFLGVVQWKQNQIWRKMESCWNFFFNVLAFLCMCIFGSHSSNRRLTSHETLIPNNRCVWMRKCFYGWAFTLLVIDLILSIFIGPFMH